MGKSNEPEKTISTVIETTQSVQFSGHRGDPASGRLQDIENLPDALEWLTRLILQLLPYHPAVPGCELRVMRCP